MLKINKFKLQILTLVIIGVIILPASGKGDDTLQGNKNKETDRRFRYGIIPVVALGQIGSKSSLGLLKERLENDPSRDVRHQLELSIDQIEKQMGATEKLLNAYISIDKSEFGAVTEGSPAPDFILEDTEGKEWQLSRLQNQGWVVLIWVFADWCPVCHGEFHDLIEMKDEFSKAGVEVFTIHYQFH